MPSSMHGEEYALCHNRAARQAIVTALLLRHHRAAGPTYPTFCIPSVAAG